MSDATIVELGILLLAVTIFFVALRAFWSGLVEDSDFLTATAVATMVLGITEIGIGRWFIGCALLVIFAVATYLACEKAEEEDFHHETAGAKI